MRFWLAEPRTGVREMGGHLRTHVVRGWEPTAPAHPRKLGYIYQPSLIFKFPDDPSRLEHTPSTNCLTVIKQMDMGGNGWVKWISRSKISGNICRQSRVQGVFHAASWQIVASYAPTYQNPADEFFCIHLPRYRSASVPRRAHIIPLRLLHSANRHIL